MSELTEDTIQEVDELQIANPPVEMPGTIKSEIKENYQRMGKKRPATAGLTVYTFFASVKLAGAS
ncbi:MAG: hypothetical protein AAF671_08335 [Pseudomonadota bacterium]